MTQEEKAKAYDKAIERAKAWCDCENATTDDKILLKRILPELAESEDEMIRKSITEFFKNFSKNGTYLAIPDVTKWIAWLEKQGEQKPNFCHHEEICLGAQKNIVKPIMMDGIIAISNMHN